MSDGSNYTSPLLAWSSLFLRRLQKMKLKNPILYTPDFYFFFKKPVQI
jgi:hypothetical protein